jgi:integrase/recombinase XerD
MMRHGAPVSFIGKQLGHMNSSSTDNYLNSFEDETIKQWQKKLTEF